MITYGRLGKCGRLGNQLWQIASTMGIAETLGQSGGFFTWDYRPFFNVPDEFFPDDYFSRELTQAHETRLVNHIAPQAREYLQDYHLWEAIEGQVWNWFQPSDTALQIIRQNREFMELPRPILSVHVRLGDNLKAPNNCHPIRPMSYYQEALNRSAPWAESIVVFSDDIAWCRDAFKDLPIDLFFEGGQPRKKEHEWGYGTDPFSDWIDLVAMSLCDMHILSNSTYSWWGAFLSRPRDPSPVYPTPFFGSDLDYIDTSLMFPDTWQPIEHGQVYI